MSKNDENSLNEDEALIALSASDRACYLYPNDDPVSRLLRQAFIAGALYATPNKISIEDSGETS